MKTNFTMLIAAAAIATTFGVSAQSASAATPVIAKAPVVETHAASKDGGVVQIRKRFGFRSFKYGYRPAYICKHHYRWVHTRFGWKQVYVGYRCGFTNNY